MKTICSRLLSVALLAFISTTVFSQDINQGINTITVKGVTFKQVADHLLKSGYAIQRMDSRSKTIQTKFSRYPLKNSSVNYSINVRMRDSVAVITGTMCYNINNINDGIPDSTHSMEVKYTFGFYKAAFLQMNNFAKSLKPEVIYSNN